MAHWLVNWRVFHDHKSIAQLTFIFLGELLCWLLLLDFGFRLHFMTDLLVQSCLHEIFILFPLLYIAFEQKPTDSVASIHATFFLSTFDIELGTKEEANKF